MNSFTLLIREIAHRPLNFLLSVLGVVVAVGACVAGPMLVDGYRRQTQDQIATLEQETDAELAKLEDQTRKAMLKMGFNLWITQRDTDMVDFWSQNFAKHDMPQEYVNRLADSDSLSLVTHLVATLQQRIEFEGRSVLLVGYLPETPKAHEKGKKPMGFNIERGTVYVGHELGAGRREGETVRVLGRELKIAKTLPPDSSIQDATLAVHLSDAQELLDRPGRVNLILALGCHCEGERLPKIRAQLAHVLPDTKITERDSIAVARAEQRDLVAEERTRRIESLADHRQRQQQRMEGLAGVVTPLLVLAGAAWVGLMALANVRQRRTEIGLLRALGKGSAKVGSLILGKAALVGVCGAGLGLAAGVWIGRALLDGALDIAAEHQRVPSGVLIAVAAGAPLVCVLAAYLPMLVAILQDPAAALRDGVDRGY